MSAAQIEVAVDPFYQPSGFELVSSSSTSGYVSDLIGTNTTDVTPDDANSLELTTTANDQAIEAIFTFKNVRSSTIDELVLTNEICASNSSTTFKYGVYDNNSSTWVYLTDTGDANYSLASYVCSTFATHHRNFAFSNNYIDANGNLKLKIITNALTSGSTIKIDYLNLLGFNELNISNTNFATQGTECTTLDGIDTLFTGTPSPCILTSRSGAPSDYFAYDDDYDTSTLDHIIDVKLSKAIIFPTGASISAIHYGFYLDNNGSITLSPQLRKYGSGSVGWQDTPGTDDLTNAEGYYNS